MRGEVKSKIAAVPPAATDIDSSPCSSMKRTAQVICTSPSSEMRSAVGIERSPLNRAAGKRVLSSIAVTRPTGWSTPARIEASGMHAESARSENSA